MRCERAQSLSGKLAPPPQLRPLPLEHERNGREDARDAGEEAGCALNGRGVVELEGEEGLSGNEGEGQHLQPARLDG